jgi:hypothetical protein
MKAKEHIGDFTYTGAGAFRTFYMSCQCGWKSQIKFFSGGFLSYYLHYMWLKHLD